MAIKRKTSTKKSTKKKAAPPKKNTTKRTTTRSTVKRTTSTRKSTPKTTTKKTKRASARPTKKTSGKSKAKKKTTKSTKGGKSKPPKRKNVSIPNGTLIITNDKHFFGTDGKSQKTRMATTVDSNRNDELAIVKYTTSSKHGRRFKNDKGFEGHSDMIYTKDNDGQPIKIDNQKFRKGSDNRRITDKQANEIKRRNVKESKYRNENVKRLRKMKKR